MNAYVEYLLSFLQDEFRGFSEVRVRPAPVGTRQKSPDLEPADDDYRPREEGVVVRTKRREYFFPATWIQAKRYSDVHQLAQEIRETLERSVE